MTAACVLLCLTLLSFHFTGGLYARYTTSASGDDGARVAKFNVTDTFTETLSLSSTPGITQVRKIVVTNNSEVAVSYVVTVENTTKNIPYKFSVNDSAPQLYQCSVPCTIAPGGDDTVTITAQWDKEGALAYMGMVDLVSISVTAQQID